MRIKENISKLSPGVKASIAFFIASVITKGIGYITMPIFTRLLTTDEYGQVAVFFTWLEVFGIVAMFCLSYGVFNNGMVDYPEKRNEFSFSMLILSNVITISFTALMVAVYPFICQWINIDFNLILLMCVLFFFQPAYNFWSARQRYEYKYKGVVLWTIICALLSPLVAVVCILVNKEGNHVYSRLYGAELVLITIYAGFYIYLASNSKFKIETQYWKTALKFNLPLIPHYLSTYLLGSADRIMISNIVGDSATAFYSVAYSVASIALIVWSAINSSLIPYTYECCNKKKYSSINMVTLPILLVFAVTCLCVILLAPEVISLAATKDYLEALYVIPPVVGGVFFQVQYYIYANVVYYYKKPKFVMIGSVTAVTLNIILNYIFIRKFGYIAAGYTTLFCYLIQAVIDYYAMKKAVNEKIYDIKQIVMMSVAVIVVALSSGIIYKYVIIRFLIIAVIIIIILLKRKQISKIIAEIKG